jgi:hypothetical protein
MQSRAQWPVEQEKKVVKVTELDILCFFFSIFFLFEKTKITGYGSAAQINKRKHNSLLTKKGKKYIKTCSACVCRVPLSPQQGVDNNVEDVNVIDRFNSHP